MNDFKVYTIKGKKQLIDKTRRKEIVIRDIREKFYMKDDAYFNGYARKCGGVASLVYDALCRYASVSDQTCYPSVALMAEKIGYSERQVMRGLKILEAFRIIVVQRERGMRNVYLLTDKTSWKDDTLFYKVGGGVRIEKVGR